MCRSDIAPALVGAFALSLAACSATASPTSGPLTLGPVSLGMSEDASIALLGSGADGIDAVTSEPAKIYTAAGHTLVLVFRDRKIDDIVFIRRQANRTMLGFPFILHRSREPFHGAPAPKIDLDTLTWFGEPANRDFTPPTPPSGWTIENQPPNTTVYVPSGDEAFASLSSDSRENTLEIKRRYRAT